MFIPLYKNEIKSYYSFFRHRRRLHVKHLHPVLDSLQSDRHLGQHADGLLLRFRRLGIADAFKSLLAQYDGITAAGCLTYTLQMLQYYRVRERKA